MEKKLLKQGDIVSINCSDSKYNGKQAIVIETRRNGRIVVGMPLKGKRMSRDSFLREELRLDDELTFENKVNTTFKEYDKIIPFTGQWNGCYHIGCNKFATKSIAVKKGKNVIEVPVCNEHTHCDGKCFSRTKLRDPTER